MINILILGANGRLARNTTRVLLESTDAYLTLYLRRSSRLANPDPSRARIVDGDVLDKKTLEAAMTGQDVVYANLSGNMAGQAQSIIEAMHSTYLKRLIFISSMGIYDEVPGQRYRRILDPYRDSALEIEKSDLDYTILRPGWFTSAAGGDLKLTQKGEAFVGHDVALDKLSGFIAKVATTPGLHIRQSLGLSTA